MKMVEISPSESDNIWRPIYPVDDIGFGLVIEIIKDTSFIPGIIGEGIHEDN